MDSRFKPPNIYEVPSRFVTIGRTFSRETNTWMIQKVAALPGIEELRLLVGVEPVIGYKEPLTHVSVSVGRVGEIGAYRRATDKEMKMVKEEWPLLKFTEGKNAGTNPYVRHIWEKP